MDGSFPMAFMDAGLDATCATHRTGSRYICDPPVMDTDDDYIVLAEAGADRAAGRLLKAGFAETSNGNDYPDDGVFMTLRRGDVNIVLTEDREFFGRFVAATEIAKRLNLRHKPDRLALFQAVLYGNTAGLSDALAVPF